MMLDICLERVGGGVGGGAGGGRAEGELVVVEGGQSRVGRGGTPPTVQRLSVQSSPSLLPAPPPVTALQFQQFKQSVRVK